MWEEAIIHLPEHVNVISLSATVSNVEEFGAWLDTVRGGTDIIVSGTARCPLWQHMMVGHRVVDLFVPEDNSAQGNSAQGKTTPGQNQEPEEKLSRKQAKKAQKAKQRGATVEAGANPLLAGLRLNPQLKALRPGFRSAPGRGRYGGKRERFRHRREGWLNETFSSGERGRPDRRDRFSNNHFGNDRDFDARGEQKPLHPQRITLRRWCAPSTSRGLLPAICFIFSRAGCDGAVSHCVSADITLTTPEQQQTIPRLHCRSNRSPGHPRPEHPRLLRSGVTASSAVSPPTTPACYPCSRRSSKPSSPRASLAGLRHRNPRTGHQHARPHRHPGKAHQSTTANPT